MILSVSSSPGKVRNYNLELLGVHIATDWSLLLTILGLLASTEVVAFAYFTVVVC